MIHPFMPFVTEEIYTQIHPQKGSISLAPWPRDHKKLVDHAAEARMQTLIDLVTSLRNLRSQWNIKPSEKIRCYLSSPSKDDLKLLEDNAAILKTLARIGELKVGQKPVKQTEAATVLVGKIKGAVPLGDVIDVKKEQARMLTQIAEQTKVSNGLASRLTNKEFVKKAPKEVVDKEKARLESINIKIEELKKVIAGLKS
jgi:valyl-tRNA synthetase